MKKTKTRIARIIAAMLCICIMCPCMTAFAMADDANAGIETTTAPEPTTEADSEAEDTEQCGYPDKQDHCTRSACADSQDLK